MQISLTNSINFQARKLIPISEYTGPVLKLTPKEESKVAELVSKKSQLLLELVSIDRLLEKKKTIIESSSLLDRRCTIECDIEGLEEEIRAIKKNRLEKQKAKQV